ncbi:DNA photolyase family protein [Alteromonas ponticola]|uniref:DNA photolyase family protein n=1 Tax=Alteromonas aquimaris TaxID=2998417 RepID=A0ABT3P6T3_9ALTE|nr:deoxyribodipyrimidine photo-lyase [Alteromonas aquimaris]MCW8108439.1 DNA photolyase family protein [Alteromonas aquimaris]
MTVPTTLVWFRQDLRVKDNPALFAACENGKIVPVYIDDTACPKKYQNGEASNWWLHKSLYSLQKRLNGHLQFFTGDPLDLIPKLAKTFECESIVWNRCYEPWRISRDQKLKTKLSEAGFNVSSFNGSLLWEPFDINKKDGTPYRVFTPFYKKGCLQQGPNPRYPQGAPSRITYQDVTNKGKSLDDLGLMPVNDWYSSIDKLWQPGEEGAADSLQDFIGKGIERYKAARDEPAARGTSFLSPHLHFGELSPHQVWYAVKDKFAGKQSVHVDTFLSEIGWREFNYHLLYHFPSMCHANFNDKFDKFNWRTDVTALHAWQKGQTGFPIVDAGMREMWQTGFMHNRVRMIVGSFLVKNLLIDWRKGEQWFWDCLLDADLANNNANWQWVAGCGADAAPYFRIFNPVLQGEKFDKEGEYVRKYCPELSALPNKYIHKPWQANEQTLKEAGVTLGEDYPEPIVDLKASRQRALDRYAQLKS